MYMYMYICMYEESVYFNISIHTLIELRALIQKQDLSCKLSSLDEIA